MTIDVIICLVGVLLLSIWLIRTSLGRSALAASPLRRNSMPLYYPFIPLCLWLCGVPVAIAVSTILLDDLTESQEILLNNSWLCLGSVCGIEVIAFLVRTSFPRGLKGFGLNIKTIVKDFFAAVVNLFTAWPIIFFVFFVTIFIGERIFGQDLQIERHYELELIMANPQLSVRVLIIIAAVVVVPVFEEMLFRGMFQTMIRSYILKPWTSIIICSVFFAIVHANPSHWPALFVLSMCIGYSYEKSGSLFRPIFIHMLFNATSIIATLNQ